MTSFSIRLNPMQLSQLGAFLNIHGRMHNNQKDLYFLEWLGLPEAADALKHTLSAAIQRQTVCCLGAHLLPNAAQAVGYSAAAQAFLQGKPPLPHLSGMVSEAQLSFALQHTQSTLPPSASRPDTLARLLCALDAVLPQLFTAQMSDAPKCVWLGEPDGDAQLLLSTLPYLGCDIAVVRPAGKQPLFAEAAARQGVTDAAFCAQAFLSALVPPTAAAPCTAAAPSARPALKLPPHPRRTPSPAPRAASPAPPPIASAAPKPRVSIQRPTAVPPAGQTTARAPLDYETLAGFSTSVVMIDVLDDFGEVQSSGSGVVLAAGGIIMTNFHVVGRGNRYAVHLENSDAVFETDQLLKYHPDFDLALLRLSGCNVPPIPLYQGAALVRGQSVFAIGSPLGLFNSVSDGIISGFREIEHKKMIQFTAPTSAGSSGGALLDRYGNLIGIVTSGFRDAQNINLAVSYEVIRQFARGFLSE